MITKGQANLTRCCGPEGCGGNSAGEPERFCIASACMAWRIATHEVPVAVGSTVYREIPDTDRGYCGLAGKPS
jgi:hypothetical protein